MKEILWIKRSNCFVHLVALSEFTMNKAPFLLFWASALIFSVVSLPLVDAFALTSSTQSSFRQSRGQSYIFSKTMRSSVHPYDSSSRLYLIEDSSSEVLYFGNSNLDVPLDETLSLHQALQQRRDDLDQGIGKRYIIRIKPGFTGVNIHYEPSGPHDTENVVGQLAEGQIVTAIAPNRGLWIRHNAGGWSLANFAGFTWLEPIDE